MDINVVRATDADRYRALDNTVWFGEPPSGPTETVLMGVPADQRFAAEVDGEYVGIYGVRPMELALPGGSLLPVAGLTWVGVHPDFRRKGVLTAMLRHHVQQTHDEGVSMSALHASEPVIYGRHGYGQAATSWWAKLSRGQELKAPGLEAEAARVRTQFATLTDPGATDRMREIDRAWARVSPGLMIGDAEFYAAFAREIPEYMRDKEPTRLLWATVEGQDVGFAAFRRTQKWESGRPQGELEVLGMAGEPAVRLALLRRLVDFDLTSSIAVNEVGVDDPLWHWVGPRAVESKVFDNVWLRLVDLQKALPEREYADDCDVVVEVSDASAPWQAGRWRLRVSGGSMSVDRTESDPDLVWPIQELSSIYLGGLTLPARLHAGVIAEARAGAVAELWHAVRTDTAPVPATGF
jgi:predicted acetyltransferase